MTAAAIQSIHRQRAAVPPEPSEASKTALRWLLPLVIAALVCVLYVNSLNNPLLPVDIAPAAFVPTPDPVSKWPTWINGQGAAPASDWTAYRPIATLSFALNTALTGATPIGFRAVNLAILVALGCALSRWVARYTMPVIGWLAAVLLVAHPSNVELVNFVIARADLLSMLGVVCFLWAHKAALDDGRWTVGRIIFAISAAAIAIGSKETGVILLPVAFAQAWLAHFRKVRPESLLRAHIVSLLILAVVFAGYLAARDKFVGIAVRVPGDVDALLDNPLRHAHPLDRIAGAFAVAGRYARQLVYPYTVFEQVPPVAPGWLAPPTILGLAAFLGGLMLTVIAWYRHRWVVLPLVLALANFLLIGNLLYPIGVYAANRLSLPFTIAGVSLAAAVIHRWTENSPRGRAAAMIPFGIAVLAMSPLVWSGNAEWSSDLARRAADATARPLSPAVRYWFGKALLDEGQVNRAIDEFNEAAKRKPESVLARTMLAEAYRRRGDIEQATLEYERVLHIAPRQWQALLVLGEIDLGRGNFDAAEKYLLAAERCAPGDVAEVTFNLAELAYQRHQDAEAIRRYEALLLRNPDHRLARQRLEELRAR